MDAWYPNGIGSVMVMSAWPLAREQGKRGRREAMSNAIVCINRRRDDQHAHRNLLRYF